MSVSVGMASPQILQRSYTANNMYEGQWRQDDTVHACLKSLSLCPTMYNTLFFSKENIETLQRAFRSRIQAKLGFVIDRQNVDALCVIMRSVMATYGKEPPCTDVTVVRQHVALLNSVVMRFALPQIASGAVAHLNYLRDASQLPVPIPLPQATSNAGTKNLPIFPGI